MATSFKLQSIDQNRLAINTSSQDSAKRSFWNVFEVVILGLVVAMAWALTTLPVIFFHLPPAESNNDQVDSSVFNGSAACPSAFPYSGVCEQPLTEALLTANCMLDPGEDILVLQNNESTASDLIAGLSLLNPSTACLEAVRPFLCLYLFGLCDKTSGVLIQPTIAQCEEVRDSVCAHEWAQALKLGAPLPRCEIFSDELAVCSVQNGSGSSGDNDPTDTEMLECSEGFFKEDPSGMCFPSCFTFMEHPRHVSIIIDVVVCLSAIIGFVSAVAVLVISLIRFKRMFAFPSVFVVYITADVLVLSFFMIVTYLDRDTLYCSSRNLLESFFEVTPFCVISGMVFTYVLLQLAVWWLMHTAALFWKVAFPLHGRKFEVARRIKKIHIACVITGLLVPLIPIITSVSVYSEDYKADSITAAQNISFLDGGLGFISTRFPPILCTGANKTAVFYSLVLLINIILAFGFLMLIIIFRIVRRQYGLLRDKSSRSHFKIGTAERKLLVVFWYYVILAAVALTTFTISISNTNLFVERLLQYFTCERSGHNPERPCDRSGFEALTQPVLVPVSYFLLGLFPAVNLVYAINIKELKEKCGVCIMKLKLNVTSDNPCTSSSAVNSSASATKKSNTMV